MSSATNHAVHSERPERSRNAKAQARHRAKRKAYIEQLEQTVTKLQTALGFTHEDVAVLPPPLLRIRELEQENARLEKENEDLRRMLSESGGRGLSTEIPRRDSVPTFQDVRICDRDYKRKKFAGDVEGAYLSPSDTPPHGDPIRPPPLTIPQPTPHHYSYTHSSAHGVSGPSSMFSLHAPAFQMPNTPSGSSATSSPPFSPAQMQEPLHSPANQRPPTMSGLQNMSNYGPRQNHYVPVKVEEEHYASSHHQQSGHYSLHPTNSYTHENTSNGMENHWHGYSSERGHLHR
ncbi:hypothetical protein LshimejAT787_0701240 [Lyophyllum shimeji]|uniref:BZIP domain-containing protein n=1 Tax=Lyophyllum shimeji TaxID=47721 RepID=A0A9P3PQC0_LYOSH|nr:hypothetical protein LshimejAT787_0701240 [Lyophyllum shimeji]